MAKILTMLAALLLILIGGNFAAAESDPTKMGYIPPAEGTTLTWSINGKPATLTIEKVMGSTITIRFGPEKVESRYAGFQDLTAGSTKLEFDPASVAKLWPLEVGKSISYNVLWPGHGVSVVSIKVIGRENVTVPAGSFDTFVIEWVENAWGRVETRHLWFAPSVGYQVRYQTQGRGFAQGEMLSISRKPTRAATGSKGMYSVPLIPVTAGTPEHCAQFLGAWGNGTWRSGKAVEIIVHTIRPDCTAQIWEVTAKEARKTDDFSVRELKSVRLADKTFGIPWSQGVNTFEIKDGKLIGTSRNKEGVVVSETTPLEKLQ